MVVGPKPFQETCFINSCSQPKLSDATFDAHTQHCIEVVRTSQGCGKFLCSSPRMVGGTVV